MVNQMQRSIPIDQAVLGGIPVLAKSRMGEDLTLYLSVFEHAVSSVLDRDKAMAETHIYYVSKALQDAETRYLESRTLH